MDIYPVNRRTRPDWLAIESWSAPDGWRLRRFRVEPSSSEGRRGSLLFQTGRADFLEKYIESFDHWRRLGWSVEGFDWRGQGGSGRLLEDSQIGHPAPFSTLVADLAAYLEEWRARTDGPHILMGHSMGGHLALRLLSERAPPVDGAVLIAPMLGLKTTPLPESIAKIIARAACRLGFSERPVWSEDEKAGSGHRQRSLTHSLERYGDEMFWRESDPMLNLGPPSWAWMTESWQSIARLQQPGSLEKVTVPTLILYAENDQLIQPRAIRDALRRLPNAVLLGSRAGAHELLRERDSIRLWALAEIDDFIESIRPITSAAGD